MAIKKEYIRIRVSPKATQKYLLNWINKKGLTGWEFLALYNDPNAKWHIYRFRRIKSSQ